MNPCITHVTFRVAGGEDWGRGGNCGGAAAGIGESAQGPRLSRFRMKNLKIHGRGDKCAKSVVLKYCYCCA